MKLRFDLVAILHIGVVLKNVVTYGLIKKN